MKCESSLKTKKKDIRACNLGILRIEVVLYIRRSQKTWNQIWILGDLNMQIKSSEKVLSIRTFTILLWLESKQLILTKVLNHTVDESTGGRTIS